MDFDSIGLDNAEVVDGFACPIDPMEALQCESCQ
jgi:ribonucleoside-diphosphate reductase alpha chain